MSKFKTYKRGQIILLDFSPSIGSEFKGKHFAIVLTKKDSPKNGVLTVVPLSSKNKKYYLNIGNVVSKQILPKLISDLENLNRFYNELMTDALKLNESELKELSENTEEFLNTANYYLERSKRSYALVQNITTVSKFRIKSPRSRYDPLKKLIVDDLILDLIDEKIIQLFTNENTHKS